MPVLRHADRFDDFVKLQWCPDCWWCLLLKLVALPVRLVIFGLFRLLAANPKENVSNGRAFAAFHAPPLNTSSGPMSARYAAPKTINPIATSLRDAERRGVFGIRAPSVSN